MADENFSVDVPIRDWEFVVGEHGNYGTWVASVTEEFIRYEADLTDQVLRGKLIELGWTPPTTEDNGPVCCVGECCGAGSYCCSRAGVHTHD